MAICKFCGKEVPKLVNSHIIPRSFYKMVSDGDKTVLFQAGSGKIEKKFFQAGIYSQMACEPCERLFTPYDTHGYHVLNEALEKKEVYRDPDGNPCAFFIPNADYRLLKIFVLSVLLRASHSDNPLFKTVQLGSHERIILEAVKTGVLPENIPYSLGFYHNVNDAYPGIILPPSRIRLRGVNGYRVIFPNVVALIAVDQRPLADVLSPMIINPNPPHFIVFFPYEGSHESIYMTKTIQEIRKIQSGGD